MARAGGKDRGLVERPKESGIWWVRVWHEGKEHWYRVGAKSAAKDLYRTIKDKQRRGRFFPEEYERKKKVPLKDFMDQVIAVSKKQSLRDDKRFAEFWGEIFKDRPIDTIKPAEIEKVQIRLLEGDGKEDMGREPSTVNRYTDFLRHVFYLAIRDNLIQSNPAARIKRFKEPAGKIRFLSETEENLLGEKIINPLHRKMVQFALNTGLRQSEQFKLRWENIDTERRTLFIPRSKSGESRSVPLNDQALGVLRSLTSWMTSPWVFPSEVSSSPMDARNFYGRIYLPALKAAKLNGEVNWHTLRHTFASRLVMAGVDLRTVQSLMGHKTIAMTIRYAHLSDAHRLDAVNRLFSSKKENVTVTKTGTKEEVISGGVS
ncbi:MAG: site-specific integrase [Nitrospirae bacterium]|nr:site-specific integrase [Candidatus Manganitrophaceae bacterium]